MQDLIRALRPVKARIRRNRLLRGLAAGFAAGSLGALVCLILAHFTAVEGKWMIAGSVFAGCMLLAGLGNALRPIKDEDAARAADGCGLQERVMTALENCGEQNTAPESRRGAMLRALEEDACRQLNTLDRRQIRCRIPKREWIAGTAALVLCAGTVLMPGPGDRAAAERQALRNKTAAIITRTQASAAEEEKALSEQEKTELRKITEDLKREMTEARDSVDAMVAVDRAEKRLEEMRNRTAGDAMDAMNAMAEAMAQAGLQEAADAIRSGDEARAQQAIENADADVLQQALSGLEGEAAQMAEALMNGEMSAAQIAQAMAQRRAASQAMEAVKQALEQMKAGLSGTGEQQSGDGKAGTAGAGQQPGDKGSSGGAGKGSTNLDEGGNGGKKSSQSAASEGNPPEFKQGQYETIYDPEKAEVLTRDAQTEQQRLGEDSVQIETGPGKGRLDGDVPFSRVVSEYAQTEARAADQAALTRQQRQWVDDYFRALTEE